MIGPVSRMATLSVALAAVLCLLVSGACSAATHAVSTVSELRSAVQNAADGDIIELADGTYAWSDATSLIVVQDKANLTIRSQSGNREAVVMQGQGIDSGTQFCIKLYRSPNCTIENMTLRDVYWHCVQVNEDSHNCTLRNLLMIDAGEGPVKVTSGGLTGYSDHGLVEDCHIAYTDRGTRGCVEGIDIVGCVGWTIRNCEFYRARKDPAPDSIGWGVFAKGNSQDTVIENCYFEDCDIPISFGGGGTSPEWFRDGDSTYEHRGGIIRNNVVNGTKDVAVYMNSATGFKLYNNTLWSTFAGADSSIDVRFNSSGDVVNNLCSQSYRLRDGGQASFSNNLHGASDTLFVSPGSGDFHLRPDATEAIDQGADTSADVPHDMDGDPRPWGAAVDIGADEYVISGPFADVPSDFWAANEITASADCGIVSGYPDGLYHPEAEVTRDQMAVFISRCICTPTGEAGMADYVPPTTPSFPDVPTEFWCYRHIEYAAEHNIVGGYGGGTYQPQLTLDRGQMAVFIARAMAGDDQSVPDPTGGPSFPDVPADFWSYRHIEYIAAEEVAGGYYDGLYHPGNLVSRDQMAVFICRAFDLPI